ncbi:DnaJ-like protein [Tanacetum coccineum]
MDTDDVMQSLLRGCDEFTWVWLKLRLSATWRGNLLGLQPCRMIETDIVNVMERRIWQSIEDGHFENLSGKGKPLNLNNNPHDDPT